MSWVAWKSIFGIDIINKNVNIIDIRADKSCVRYRLYPYLN